MPAQRVGHQLCVVTWIVQRRNIPVIRIAHHESYPLLGRRGAGRQQQK
jgi:hypothetical protein